MIFLIEDINPFDNPSEALENINNENNFGDYEDLNNTETQSQTIEELKKSAEKVAKRENIPVVWGVYSLDQSGYFRTLIFITYPNGETIEYFLGLIMATYLAFSILDKRENTLQKLQEDLDKIGYYIILNSTAKFILKKFEIQ